jgi:hypothetical protein
VSAVDPGRQAPASTDEPMAADRRTLTIGAIAMVLLIVVGAVSGALFARSACDDIGPSTVAAPLASAEVVTLREIVPGLDAEQRGRWEEELTRLAAELGPVTGVADASGAGRLQATDVGPAAVGATVVQLDASGAQVAHAVSVGAGTVVGSGAHLYSLALPNELTGQVDALQPLDADLGGLTCVDTALVGSPLAFHLDAGGGQLLLLRIEEDGDDAELELRDPVAGQFWGSEVELPAAPAGLAGARLTAGLGPDLVVAGTRTNPGEEAPVLTAVARADGTPRWQVTRDDLVAAGVSLPDDVPTRAEVLRVGDELALVGLRDVDGTGTANEEAEQDALAARRQLVLGVDVSDGTVRFSATLPPADRTVAGSVTGEVGLLVTVDVGDGRTRLLQVDAGGLEVLADTELRGSVLEELDRVAAAARGAVGTPVQPLPGGIAELPDGRRVVVTGASVLLLPAADAAADEPIVEVELPATAVVAHEGGVSLLLLGPDEGRAVVTLGG